MCVDVGARTVPRSSRPDPGGRSTLCEIVAAFAVVKDDVRQLDVKRMVLELNLNEQGSVEHFSLAVRRSTR